MRFDRYNTASAGVRRVVDVVRARGPVGKEQIAFLTGLDISDVNRIISTLDDGGFLKNEDGLFAFDETAYYLICVELGQKTLRAIITSLDGGVIIRRETEMGCLIDLIDAAIYDSGVPMDKFLALGISGTDEWRGLTELQKRYMLHTDIISNAEAADIARELFTAFLEMGDTYIRL